MTEVTIDTDLQEYSPQFRGKSFGDEDMFNEWLKANTRYEVELEDSGQDLLKLYIHESGEILSTELPSLSHVFNGQMIELANLGVGICPTFADKPSALIYKVIRINKNAEA